MFIKILRRIKRLNKMWLLLLIPMGLLMAAISLPLLLITMMTGTRLLSIFIGPVNIWNTPNHAPPPKDVAGIYTPDDASRAEWAREHITLSALSYIKLNEDHTLEVHDMPAFNGVGEFQNCQYSATGKWGFYESGNEVEVNLYLTAPDSQPNNRSCGQEGASIELLGRDQPYHLYQTVGDPDSGTGITYLHR
jgi:hypothetical protein